MGEFLELVIMLWMANGLYFYFSRKGPRCRGGRYFGGRVMDEELEALIEKAREWARTATPEQKAEMDRLQRESWIRGMAPCEHGDPDWETCPQCLMLYR